MTHSQEHGIWYNCLRTKNMPLCTIYALYISIAEMLAVTWSDGSLALYTVKADTGAADCLTLPPDAAVAAMDWSPKGKQLVVVRANCDLVQYKPDFSVAKYPKLQEMKTVKGEYLQFNSSLLKLFPPGPSQTGLKGVSVTWLSTYEFLIGVQDVSDPSSVRPSLWLVTGSKAGPVEHCNYDDICYRWLLR